MSYRHTADMGEISGFGGGYENMCQNMLEAGVIWLEQHKNADLKGHTYKNVFGLFNADSEDAKALEIAVLVPTDGEATGAMVHAVMSRLFYIAKNGWNAYCKECIDANLKRTSSNLVH